MSGVFFVLDKKKLAFEKVGAEVHTYLHRAELDSSSLVACGRLPLPGVILFLGNLARSEKGGGRLRMGPVPRAPPPVVLESCKAARCHRIFKPNWCEETSPRQRPLSQVTPRHDIMCVNFHVYMYEYVARTINLETQSNAIEAAVELL